MKTIRINGILFESADALKARLNISEATVNRRQKSGGLPVPIRLSKTRYYDRDLVNECVLGWTQYGLGGTNKEKTGE